MTVAQLADRLAAQPDRSGLFLDFDGTLAPIVEDPTASAMAPGLRPLVARLAQRLGLLAVVSGRPAAFLQDHVEVPRARLLGLYGLEEAAGGKIHPRPEAAAWQPAVDEARDRLGAALVGLEGVLLEDKGLSVALHWRRAPDRAKAAAAVGRLVADIAAELGLHREPGKMVEELRPPVAWDKGASVRALAAELDLTAVAYVGDDLGDLAAFAAVRELGGVAVAVRQGEETPERLLAAADLAVDGTGGVEALLQELGARLG